MSPRKKPTVEGIEAIEAQAATNEGGCSNCAHCAKSDGLIQTHSIIQYGFVVDKCSEIYLCQYCGLYTIVNYAVLVTITELGIEYLENEANGH